MIERNDVKKFYGLVDELNTLMKHIQSYNPQTKLNVYAYLDKEENDKCGLILSEGTDAIYGSILDGAELYTRNDILTVMHGK